MNNKRKEVKDALHDGLVIEVDPIMKEHGFTRVRKSLTYRRKVEYGRQELTFCIHCRAYGYASLCPYVDFYSPVIYDTAKEVFKETPFKIPVWGGFLYTNARIFSKNMEHLVPISPSDYSLYVDDRDDMRRVAHLLFEIIDKYVLPFMDAHSSFESIIHFDKDLPPFPLGTQQARTNHSFEQDPPSPVLLLHEVLGHIYRKNYQEAFNKIIKCRQVYTLGGHDGEIISYILSHTNEKLF